MYSSPRFFLSKKEEYCHLAHVDFDFGQVHIVWWLSYCQVEEKISVEPCITVNIYSNVKSEILMFISVENIVVQLNRLLYISSYMKWSWDNKPLHGSDAIHVCPLLMSWVPMFSREADWGCYVMLG